MLIQEITGGSVRDKEQSFFQRPLVHRICGALLIFVTVFALFPQSITQALRKTQTTARYDGSSTSGNFLNRNLQENGRVEVYVAQAPGYDMMDVSLREQQLGSIGLDGVMMYSIVWDLDYTNVVKPYLDKGYKVVICLEFVDLFPNLKEIGDGLYDAELTVFAKDIRDGLKEVEIRPMHEFNGNWYEWCTYLGGTNTKKNFIRAWAHIVDLFREIGAPVRWQLNYNNNNYADSTDPFSDWYPGDQYVDVVCISGYNRAGVVNSDQVWTSFEDVVKNAYESIVAMTDKPVCIGETSSSDIGGDKAAWILDAFETIATKYTHIIGITWFLYNKVGDGNWDLNTGNEINAFVDGINYVRDNAVVPYGDDYANYFDYNIGTLSPTNAPTYSPTNSPVHFTEDDETGNPAFIA